MRLLLLLVLGLLFAQNIAGTPRRHLHPSATVKRIFGFNHWRGGSSTNQTLHTWKSGALSTTVAVSSGDFIPRIPDALRRKQTLKKLTLGNVDIYLIGTAHVSNDSSAEVGQLLRAVHPHAIFVELCDARTALLEDWRGHVNASASSDGPGKGPKFWEKLQLTQQQQGGSRMQAISTVLLTSVQQDYADTLGVELGGEFQCAHRYWRSVIPRPYLLLGDRPLQLTLVRAWESLWWWPKCKVIVGLVWSSLFKPSKDEIRQWLATVMADNSDVLTESFKELQRHFPTLYATIIDERDTWLAAKLTQTCRALSMRRSEHFRLVAIVGAGHVPGICKKLTSASPTNQTVEQILYKLCQTRKWAKDPDVQERLIPVWVNEITQLQDSVG